MADFDPEAFLSDADSRGIAIQDEPPDFDASRFLALTQPPPAPAPQFDPGAFLQATSPRPPSPTPAADNAAGDVPTYDRFIPQTPTTAEEIAGEKEFAVAHPQLYPWMKGAAKAVKGMVPTSWEQVREMIKPPIQGAAGEENVQKQQEQLVQEANYWGEAVTGKLGPEAQGEAVVATAIQAAPLLHLPFAKGPFAPRIPLERPPETVVPSGAEVPRAAEPETTIRPEQVPEAAPTVTITERPLPEGDIGGTHAVDITTPQGADVGVIGLNKPPEGNVQVNLGVIDQGAQGRGYYQDALRQMADNYGQIQSDTTFLDPAAEAAWQKVGAEQQPDGSYILKGGETDASKVTGAEGIPRGEVRPGVDEEASLRQQGETAPVRPAERGGEQTPAPEQPVAPATPGKFGRARIERAAEEAAVGATGAPPAAASPAAPVNPNLNPVRGSGKFRTTYQIDKGLGDAMERIGASREAGALRGQYAVKKVLEGLSPSQQQNVGKYLVSERLKTVNPQHAQVLSPAETARIQADPNVASAINRYATQVKPDVEALRLKAGLSPTAAASKGAEFISLVPEPVKPRTGGKIPQASKLSRKTKFAQQATGQAANYSTDLKTILPEVYGEVQRKANVAQFYKDVQAKGVASPSLVHTAKGPRMAVTFDDLPPQLQHDLRAATEREFEPTGLAGVGRKVQRLTTGIALTANPAELLNHMRRQLNLVSSVPPVGRGLAARLEAVVPYLGPKVGTFLRAVTDDMNTAANRGILQDVFDAGGGSSRSFSSMYSSKIPGVKQLQHFTHELLFGVPKGRGVGGWDLRMRVQLEKIRRQVEGNTDPQRIREFANQLGQYGAHPDWIIRGMRTINPYAATTLPMRLTELKRAVGTSGVKSSSAMANIGRRAETLLRGTGGTLVGLAVANYAMSGKWPWENDSGHEFDLNTGQVGEDGRRLYVKFRVIAPELSRPIATAGIPNIMREKTAKQPQYLSAFLTGLANQGLSLVSGPAQNALLSALAGKAPYITKSPGGMPEIMDIAQGPKAQKIRFPTGKVVTAPAPESSRGLRQLGHALSGVNPLGTLVSEEPFKAQPTGVLKYIEQPVPGIRPFGSMYTEAYEKKGGMTPQQLLRLQQGRRTR